MMQNIDIIRLSEKQKQQLIILKRKTGIENWNVLCRWALCMSLADPTTPPKEDIPSDSNVEMTWKTLGGEFESAYLAAVKISLNKSNSNLTFNEYFRCHLSRGMSILNNKW
ncbi:MAG: DNA sulfur modification protein DndE [Candidatus Brocadia sp. WS118]|nr:MAG: DNA sulfur modification protein DndE [Candidatus Brocadia sp. WS118]